MNFDTSNDMPKRTGTQVRRKTLIFVLRLLCPSLVLFLVASRSPVAPPYRASALEVLTISAALLRRNRRRDAERPHSRALSLGSTWRSDR